MRPLTINGNRLLSYVTLNVQGIELWRERSKGSSFARTTEFDYIYVLFRELAARRFTYTPDLAEIDNFIKSPKPLFENGVIDRDDAGLLIRSALGEDGLLFHISYENRSVTQLRLCVYLYREVGMSEQDLSFLLVQVERAVAKDYPELAPE